MNNETIIVTDMSTQDFQLIERMTIALEKIAIFLEEIVNK